MNPKAFLENAYNLDISAQKSKGLLETVKLLINHISNLKLEQDKGLSYKEVTLSNIKAFIEKSPVSVAFLDKDLNFLSFSKAWGAWFKKYLELSKTPSDEWLGKNILSLAHPCPKPIQKLLSLTVKGKFQRKNLVEYEIKNKRRYIRWESFPWYDQENSLWGIIVFSEDITKKHQLALNNKKLEQCNNMLGNFALVFSHDLIQPMRQVSNFVTILQDRFKAIDSKDPLIDYAFLAINKSLSQINNLSEGMVLYCKKGDLTVNSEPVPLKSVIEEIRGSCLVTSQAFLNILIEEEIYLYANKVCILQLFQNLLINAVKHSIGEKPIITIEGKNLKNGYYKVAIHNQGVCSSRAIKRTIFQPFSSSFADGAGLGLMICQKIVQAYKGTISIKSSNKNGTTVSFTLPLAAK